MVLFVQEMLLVLFVELFGVAVTAGVIFLYWNCMTKKCRQNL